MFHLGSIFSVMAILDVGGDIHPFRDQFFSEIKILHGDISVPVYHVQLQKICQMWSEGYLGLPGGVGKGGNFG